MKVGISIVDILCSLYAGMAILAALRHRDQVSGRGQHIDFALVDCGIASLSHFATVAARIEHRVALLRERLGLDIAAIAELRRVGAI
jgi:crotonobetainyl-CoA:carnitine CoA-transferase CaiB-like acyl-CoA transferase